MHRPILLHEFFAATVARDPGRVALVCAGRRIGYVELAEHIDALAAALRGRSVGRGDRVALFLDNSVEMIVGLYATLRIGAVFVPINPLTKADKLAYMLNDAQVSALLTQTELTSVATRALTSAASVHSCWVAGVEAAEVLDQRDVLRMPWPPPTAAGAKSSVSEPVVIDPGTIDQDLAAILYTSGSTGRPKGVMLTHLNMITAQESVSRYLGLCAADIIVCALPLSFDYGLYQVLMAFKLGASVVLERSFTYPVRVLDTMAREGATVFPGVPTMFALLMNLDLSDYDLSALRLVTNTAAALPEAHIRAIRRMFPKARLYSMYGLTECKRVSYLPPEQLDIRPGSVGRGMPNQEIWLIDAAGKRLPHGATGELVIRGSHVMRGYWNKPQETAERLRPGLGLGQTLLYSGDLFRSDAEGYLYFIGRADDMIKSRGEKVSPREVENVLCELQGVAEAAVIGVDDVLLGQAVKAFIVLAPGYRYSEREVVKHSLARLEGFMTPKIVEFVPVLPRTDRGKIDKIALRQGSLGPVRDIGSHRGQREQSK